MEYKNKKNLIHLKRKDLRSENNNHDNDNLYKKLPLFSYKILEAKHSSTPELYLQIILNNLIFRKKGHLLAYINELAISSNILRELLKRFYDYEESRERIPKYVSYYQNYLKFFCRPVFSDYFSNKKMVKHMEKVAQIFYNENYADEDELEDSDRHEKMNFKIFTKTITEEIENCNKFNISNNSRENKNNKKNNNNIKSKTININDKYISDNKELDILEKIYKITPIGNKNKKDIKKNKNISEIETYKNTEYNSFELILKEMSHKKKVKSKEGNTKKSNKISHNSNIFDYFNSLSGVFFGKKRKFLHKNNSVNNKYNKKKNKKKLENYNTNNNKIVNNINININHLTLGQKSLNPPSDINNFHSNNIAHKRSKKRKINSRKNNSMVLRDKSFKNLLNVFGNITNKHLEYKKRNDSFKLMKPINGVIGYKSNKNKKTPNINSYTNISNGRNKSSLKGGSGRKINNGCITSLHKYKKKINNSKKHLGKIQIYTNNNNYIKNMYNIIDFNSNSKLIRHSNKNNNSIINFNSYNNHNNISSLYKNSSLALMSPLIWNKKHKNNISLKKGISIISYERIISTSNKSRKHKKNFSPTFNMSTGNINLINSSHNFISPKNTLMNNNLSRLKFNNENSNDNSYPENIPAINKYNSIFNKKKLKEEQQFGISNNIINMKFKNSIKLLCLRKTLKILPKKIRNKTKGKNSNKKNK